MMQCLWGGTPVPRPASLLANLAGIVDSTNESRNNTSNKCFLSPNMSTLWESGASE
jgi:hypothetical protein